MVISNKLLDNSRIIELRGAHHWSPTLHIPPVPSVTPTQQTGAGHSGAGNYRPHSDFQAFHMFRGFGSLQVL